MKITVFTSNQPRHLHLIEQLSGIADECHAVMECNTVFPGRVQDFYKKTETFQEYFSHVIEAEKALFGRPRFLATPHTLTLKGGDLNMVERDILEPALNADVFVVFGASYIKGWLIDFLVSRKCLNIHMGLSPYYRGSSCNFWALYDNNPHLVGATIHMLSKGLDSGDMLYHIAPTTRGCSNPYEYTMLTVKNAHQSLVERIADGSIFTYEPVAQDNTHQVRYTRNSDFDDAVAREFIDRKLTLKDIERELDKRRNEVELLHPYA